MTDGTTITITMEEMFLYRLGMQETLEIMCPGQLPFISYYYENNVYNAFGDIYDNISIVLK